MMVVNLGKTMMDIKITMNTDNTDVNPNHHEWISMIRKTMMFLNQWCFLNHHSMIGKTTMNQWWLVIVIADDG